MSYHFLQAFSVGSGLRQVLGGGFRRGFVVRNGVHCRKRQA